MTNSEIVDLLELTGRLMELHEQDAFRTRAFTSAAFNLDKSPADLANLPVEELVKLPGVGKSVAHKIREIAETGRLTDLDDLLAQTPSGVLDMFRIKGLGVKKIGTLWRESGIDNLTDKKAPTPRNLGTVNSFPDTYNVVERSYGVSAMKKFLRRASR